MRGGANPRMRIEPARIIEYMERQEAPLIKAKEGSPADRPIRDVKLEEPDRSTYPSFVSILFTIHKDTGKLLIKIVDEGTKEVIREIPPEKLLEVKKVLREVSKKLGMLVDEVR